MLATFVIGLVLSLAVCCFATIIRLDGDRAFFPTVLIVIAACYVLFAVIGGTPPTIIAESAMAAAFLFAATLGFRRNLWLVVAALAAHGVFDVLHGIVIANPGVPVWWPTFCLSYDLTAAAFLAWTLHRDPHKRAPHTAATPR
ncbi:MAG: hypothetical protein ABIQ10_01380 [Gemmatimonadaceae bacterium]